MPECSLWVLPICHSNPFEATIGMEEVSCSEEKQTAPIQCSLLAGKLHLAARGLGQFPSETVRPTSLIHPWNWPETVQGPDVSPKLTFVYVL